MTRILDALDAEWAHLAASSAAAQALDRWRETDPDLDVPTLNALMRARANGNWNDVLAALARRAPSDRLAARVLLQALVPGLGSLARSLGGRDVAPELLSFAWERIRTYPSGRPGSVAANTLLDVRKAYLASVSDSLPAGAGIEDAVLVDSAEEVVLGGNADDLVRRLVAARDNGVISDDSLRAIVRTRVCGDTVAEAAAGECVTVALLRARRWRGERVLRECLAHLPLAG